MHERSLNNEKQHVFDGYPEGWGEVPADGTPVETSPDNLRTVKYPDELKREAARFGPLRRLTDRFMDRSLAVGLQFRGPNNVRVFVAEHKDSIRKVKSPKKVVAAGAAAGIVFLGEEVVRRKRKKN